jgi:hypothetical protein
VLPAEAPRERRGPLIVLRALAGCALAAALAVAAGCGDDEADGGAADGGGGSSGATTLTLVLDRDGEEGSQPPEEKSVDCAADPDDAACAALADVTAADLGPVPPDTACTEIFGGPDELQVSGTLHGQPVDETLTRANGCEIERYDALTPALRELFPGYTPGEAIQGGY